MEYGVVGCQHADGWNLRELVVNAEGDVFSNALCTSLWSLITLDTLGPLHLYSVRSRRSTLVSLAFLRAVCGQNRCCEWRASLMRCVYSATRAFTTFMFPTLHSFGLDVHLFFPGLQAPQIQSRILEVEADPGRTGLAFHLDPLCRPCRLCPFHTSLRLHVSCARQQTTRMCTLASGSSSKTSSLTCSIQCWTLPRRPVLGPPVQTPPALEVLSAGHESPRQSCRCLARMNHQRRSQRRRHKDSMSRLTASDSCLRWKLYDLYSRSICHEQFCQP